MVGVGLGASLPCKPLSIRKEVYHDDTKIAPGVQSIFYVGI